MRSLRPLIRHVNRNYLFYTRRFKFTSASDYQVKANHCLECVIEMLESADETCPNLDYEEGDGVLNITEKVAGTWVLNKQAPNEQIWLSSPFSGPRRFNYEHETQKWLDHRKEKASLQTVLENELTTALGVAMKSEEKF